MIRTLRNLTLILVAGVIMSQTTQANAQSLKYFAAGFNASYFPDSGDYDGVGVGNLLGKQTLDGNVIPDGDFFPEEGVFFSGTFAGTQTLIAANGDTIETEVTGTVVLSFNDDGLVEGEWYPSFEVIGGSGRFENATGSFEGVAINPPFDPFNDPVWPFDWYAEGEIDLGKKGKK